MPYCWLDLDLDAPLPNVALAPEEAGWAVLVRRKGRPVAFWIEPLALGATVAPEALEARVTREVGALALREELREAIPLRNAPAAPRLTVAICTRDRPERLARCLDALAGVEVPPGMAAPEVLVVDNAPPDDRTREAVAARPSVRYAVEPVPGLNFGRNRALAEASGEWVAYLDDDVVPDPTWLTGLSTAWREHPDARAVTGLVLPFALETEAQVLFERAGGFRRGCRTIRHEPEWPEDPHYPAGAGTFGAGANMAFHRDTLRALGGFDEALDTGPPLPGGGDLDAFYSVLRAGHPLVYEPAALVFHEHRRDLEGLRYQYYTWGLGFMAYVGKHLRGDPAMRERFRRLVRWWFRYQHRGILASLRGRHPLPAAMRLAEWRGGWSGSGGSTSAPAAAWRSGEPPWRPGSPRPPRPPPYRRPKRTSKRHRPRHQPPRARPAPSYPLRWITSPTPTALPSPLSRGGGGRCGRS
jgi:GT2 family glycosyltransferase